MRDFPRALFGIDPAALYLNPQGLLAGAVASAAFQAGIALSTGRPGEAAASVEILVRREGGAESFLASAGEFRHWLDTEAESAATARLRQLAQQLEAPRAPWAGLALDRPLVMGIVNVTPDSFSDGGDFLDAEAAVTHGLGLLAAGADLLDIGGESTRPGALPVAPETEAMRVVPVIRALAAAGAIVSVDTRRPEVMAAALAAGARIVNDVTALRGPGALELVARHGTSVVLMHMQGEPRAMQVDPRYRSVALDIFDFFEARIAACTAAGIPRSDILIDPGIGFGKTLAHNLELLDRLGLFRASGCGILLGVSRKSFLARLVGEGPAKDRLGASLGAGLAGIQRGADVLRVHDVAETVQALRVIAALTAPG
jgi:dihydropteroate synthase